MNISFSTVDNCKVSLQIWDTAGQGNYIGHAFFLKKKKKRERNQLRHVQKQSKDALSFFFRINHYSPTFIDMILLFFLYLIKITRP